MSTMPLAQKATGLAGLGIHKGELFVALGVILTLLVMLFPMPPIVLDLLLSFNLTFSLMVLLVSLYTIRPIEFFIFPSLLLVTTLFRLSLEVASTRMILLHGYEGLGAAGRVIHSFGSFVVGGNYVVGGIMFLILVVINFIVIIKGSTRIAEVAARFTLDALDHMPGDRSPHGPRPDFHDIGTAPYNEIAFGLSVEFIDGQPHHLAAPVEQLFTQGFTAAADAAHGVAVAALRIFHLAHQFQGSRRHESVADAVACDQVEGFFRVELFGPVGQHGNAVMPAGEKHIDEPADLGPVRRGPEKIVFAGEKIMGKLNSRQMT